jgi:endoglucanase
MSRPTRTSLAVLSALTVLGLAAGCASPGSPAGSRSGDTSVGGATEKAGDAVRPAAGSPFWVDPANPATRQIQRWEDEGRGRDAALLRRIAERATALWPAGDDPVPVIAQAVAAAGREHRTAVFVAYNIPHRDCGRHSAGGAEDSGAYLRWIDAFAGALGGGDALVVLEPDAVAHIVDGCTPGEYRAEREGLLGEAVDRLKERPRTKVYVDAGNPAWIVDPRDLVAPLRRSGIARADGFSLNVSNFQTDAATRAYGLRLSEALGGKHFVVDTSRNGNGPLNGERGTAWCNPPGRALGTAPTTDTGEPALDAYLWIKRPGESDGECRGGPAAGTWWPDYALGLARNTKA